MSENRLIREEGADFYLTRKPLTIPFHISGRLIRFIQIKWRRSQAVRQRFAKPLYASSILAAASIFPQRNPRSGIPFFLRQQPPAEAVFWANVHCLVDMAVFFRIIVIGGGVECPWAFFPGDYMWWCLFFLCLVLSLMSVVLGCKSQSDDTLGPGLSLVEIGERSVESGERLARQGNKSEAATAYRRAIWAFNYHESLTGTQPILLDDAKDGLRRLERGR